MTVNVHVVTRKMNSDDAGSHVVIDHDNSIHRQWMAKHCWWAMRSGYQVLSFPTDEAVTFKGSLRK